MLVSTFGFTEHKLLMLVLVSASLVKTRLYSFPKRYLESCLDKFNRAKGTLVTMHNVLLGV